MKQEYSVTTPQHRLRLMLGHKNYNKIAFNLSAVMIPQKYFAPIYFAHEKVKDIEELAGYNTPSARVQYLINIIWEQHVLGKDKDYLDKD